MGLQEKERKVRTKVEEVDKLIKSKKTGGLNYQRRQNINKKKTAEKVRMWQERNGNSHEERNIFRNNKWSTKEEPKEGTVQRVSKTEERLGGNNKQEEAQEYRRNKYEENRLEEVRNRKRSKKRDNYMDDSRQEEQEE